MSKQLKKDRRKLEKISDEIEERINELGNEDVMSYRHDTKIKTLVNEICEIYAEGNEECQHKNEQGDPICALFKEEPEVIRRLELTEEIMCPIREASKKKK
jgi:hypothetical protein